MSFKYTMQNTSPTDWTEDPATRAWNGPNRWDPYPTRRGQEWREQALCAGDSTEKFYSDPVGGDDARDALIRALLLCGRCPVREACLRDAVLEKDTWAVRGGTTPWHRGSGTQHAKRQRGIPELNVILAAEADLRAGRTWEEIRERTGATPLIIKSLSRITGIEIEPPKNLDTPFAQQVREALSEIVDQFNNGDTLPSTTELAEMVGCSRTSLRKIVVEFVNEGRLQRFASNRQLRVVKETEERAA